MNICLFSEDEIEKPLDLRDERAQHILKILHKKEGDFFNCGIISGMAGSAKILKIDDEGIYFEFEAKTDGKKLFPLSMIIGFPRPIQLKRLLRDMAALGVQSVHLCGTELGEKSYLKADLAKPDAGYKMLYDGTVQAASTHIPKLFVHQNLKECVEAVKKEFESDVDFLALDNVMPTESLKNHLSKTCAKNFVAAIGSERGWTDNERGFLKSNGFSLLSMGNRVMRTETAATVAASIILNSMDKLD